LHFGDFGTTLEVSTLVTTHFGDFGGNSVSRAFYQAKPIRLHFGDFGKMPMFCRSVLPLRPFRARQITGYCRSCRCLPPSDHGRAGSNTRRYAYATSRKGREGKTSATSAKGRFGKSIVRTPNRRSGNTLRHDFGMDRIEAIAVERLATSQTSALQE
jgi:hypothetical protein